MAVTINASTTAGLVTSADTSGDLDLQAGGVTKIAVTSAGVSLATPLAAASGGTGLSSVGTSGNLLTSNGTAWVSSAPPASGKVLQVVNAASTTSASTTSATYVDTGICTASITTTAANSKLLVIQTFAPEILISATTRMLVGMRSSLDSYGSNLAQTAINYSAAYGVQTNSTLQYLHNPLQASGTTITYKLYWLRAAGSNTQYLGDGWDINPTNTITILEVAA